MKKKKKNIIFIVFIVFVSSIAFISGFFGIRAIKEDESATYTIRYVGVLDGEEASIPSCLYSATGVYPTEYRAGDTTQVSDLCGKMETFDFVLDENELPSVILAGSPVTDPADGNKTYSFYGWYYDRACMYSFNGVIPSNVSGHITLYAKISVDSWTAAY